VRTIVQFEAGDGRYAVAVDEVSEVRPAVGLTALPAPRPGVAGLMQRSGDALPVLEVLSSAGKHIVVIERGARSFGLLVDEVTGVQAVAEDRFSPPPAGQDHAFVSGVLNDERGLVLLLDVDLLANRLAP
jgi:chemotaxis signal transduction protein